MPNREPTINVNLTKCERHDLPFSKEETAYHVLRGTGNLARCEAPPILIPCPIPRSVTFEVVLGECACVTRPGPMLLRRTIGLVAEMHETACPTRTVKVSCSISGKTWEESEVDDTETIVTSSSGLGRDAYPNERVAARERWALAKALVLGKPYAQVVHANMDAARIGAMAHQRDAVFSAISDMAKAEDNLSAARERAASAIGHRLYVGAVSQSAEDVLGQYVERLIEQVGVLS